MNMWNEPASATSSPAFPASLDWSDSDRVSVLFSPMRSRQLNPEAHDGKVAFWTGVIERWADSNGRTTFTIDELESELSVGERRPHCLAEVVASLEESGKVRKADEARAEWERRAAGAGAIGETLRRAGSSLLARVWGGGPPAGQVSYVFVDRVKSASEALLRDLQKVDSYDLGDLAFAVEASNVKSDSNDEEDMCVAFLRGEGLLAAGEVDGVRYLKFSGQKGRGVSVFKDTDKGVIGLRRGKAAAEERLVEAERTHAEAMQKVRHLLATGGRQRAKAMLLRAKRKEATVVRMENVVGTLEDILDKIEASRTDEQVVRSYKAGLAALNERLALPEMDADRVDDLVKRIRHAVDDVEEVSEALAAAPSGNDDADLLAELEKLAKEEEEKKESDTDDELVARLDKLRIPQSTGDAEGVDSKKKRAVMM